MMAEVWNDHIMAHWNAVIVPVLPPAVLEATQKFDAMVVDAVGDRAKEFNPTAVVALFLAVYMVMKILTGAQTCIRVLVSTIDAQRCKFIEFSYVKGGLLCLL